MKVKSFNLFSVLPQAISMRPGTLPGCALMLNAAEGNQPMWLPKSSTDRNFKDYNSLSGI